MGPGRGARRVVRQGAAVPRGTGSRNTRTKSHEEDEENKGTKTDKENTMSRKGTKRHSRSRRRPSWRCSARQRIPVRVLSGMAEAAPGSCIPNETSTSPATAQRQTPGEEGGRTMTARRTRSRVSSSVLGPDDDEATARQHDGRRGAPSCSTRYCAARGRGAVGRNSHTGVRSTARTVTPVLVRSLAGRHRSGVVPWALTVVSTRALGL